LSRTTLERLTDIRDAARDLLDFVGTMESEAIHALPATDRMAHRAIKTALVEIGEAIKMSPPEITLRHPAIDWRGFARLRDVITHGYFGLDQERLWPIIRDEIPNLLAAIDHELGRPTPGQ
jgi:uncharacterized protein with HEPN domain